MEINSMETFRKEVFKMCNSIKNLTELNPLRRIMKSFLPSKDINTIDFKKMAFSNGIQLNMGFHGILLAFENRLIIPSNSAAKIDLTDDEFTQLSLGNYLIESFVEMCLEDIKRINKPLAKALSPFSFYKPLVNKRNYPEFDLTLFKKAADSFKSASIYLNFLKSPLFRSLVSVKEDDATNLIYALDKRVIKISTDDIPNDIKDIVLKKHSGLLDDAANYSYQSFLLIALREMLTLACRLLYSAIIGNDLIVINSDDLIDIKNNSHNVVYRTYTLLIQGAVFIPFDNTIGNVVLFDFAKKDISIHEFGTIREVTINYSQETGNTSTITFCAVDDDLNPIYTLTK